MSDARADEPDGATPLTDEDLRGLRPSWVATRADLDRAEAEAILRARAGLQRRRRRAPFWYLDASGLKALHGALFGEVWTWAGTLRRHATNIGVEPFEIPLRLHDLCADVRAQIGTGGAPAYPPDELAVRFHHRLALIHPFPNGNGRHARFAAELLLADLGGAPLTWGGGDLVEASALRAEYVAALRRADRGDIDALLAFATRP